MKTGNHPSVPKSPATAPAMIGVQQTSEGLCFKVFVQPRSSRNMISGLHQDALKVKLKAPPVDGAANKMCIEYLAKLLGVAKSSLEITAGLTGRNKTLFVRTETQAQRDELCRRIQSLPASEQSP
jgi:uncharacterized protein (TIGR00251 family)